MFLVPSPCSGDPELTYPDHLLPGSGRGGPAGVRHGAHPGQTRHPDDLSYYAQVVRQAGALTHYGGSDSSYPLSFREDAFQKLFGKSG